MKYAYIKDAKLKYYQSRKFISDILNSIFVILGRQKILKRWKKRRNIILQA